MKSKLNIVFAVFAGLVGGMLTRYIAPQTAFAQNQTPVTKERSVRRLSRSLIHRIAPSVRLPSRVDQVDRW